MSFKGGKKVQRKDEKKSGTAAESSPKKPGSIHVGRRENGKVFETEIQQERAAQKTAFPTEAKSPSSSPDPEPAKFSHVTAGRNREKAFSRSGSAKDDTDIVQHNIKSVATTPHAELITGTGETGNANTCPHDDASPSVMKRRKLESHTSNEMRDSKESKGKEVAFENRYNRSHVHHNQDLFETSADHSKKRKLSVATNGASFSGTGGCLGSSEPKSHHQITYSPEAAPARSYQSIIGSPSVLAALALRSSAKHEHSEPEKLTVHYQPPISSKFVSTRFLKDSRLLPDNPAETRMQVLRPRKEVNRSWTSHFPAKAKIHRCANSPAPSLLVAPFAPIKSLPTTTDLHAHTHFLNTHPSSLLPNYLSLPKAFNYPLDGCILGDSFDTANASNQRQSARRRSASMPNIWTYAPVNMDSSNRFGPASMPTPPHEQSSSPEYLPCSSPLSHNDNPPFRQNVIDPPGVHVDMSFNVGNSSSQNWQVNSNLQRQHENGLSNTQNKGFTPRQLMTQHSSNQGMNEKMAAGGRQYARRRLEIKSNYSHEEVKALMFNAVGQAKVLQAENTRLLSLNAAMKKGFESLQHEKLDMVQKIQHYERTDAQKDLQMDVMRRKGASLQHHFKESWDEHSKLLATVRREKGNGNPSAIAERIRWYHSPNAVGADNQGRQFSENASAVYHANRAQLPNSRPGFEQTPTGFQGHVQPVPLPAYSEANVTKAPSRSLCQQGYAAANHNNASPSQTAHIPAYSEADVAKASSRALSQPGYASANHDDANSPQPVSISTYPEAKVASDSGQASVQPGIAAANHNSANSPHDVSTGFLSSNQPLNAAVRTATVNGHYNKRSTEQVPMELVTFDLSDDSQPSSCSTSRDTSVHQTYGSSVQGGHQLSSFPPGQYPPAHRPAGHFASSQQPSGLAPQNQMSQSQPSSDQDPQGRNLEAMQIQKEAYARMAQKPLSWLQGVNPFRKGTEINPFKKGTKTGERPGLPDSRLPSQSNVEDNVPFAQPPEAGSVAPLPETVTGRNTREQVPKTKVVLTADEKKAKAKGYRKTAAEKKKREKEIAKQSVQDENMSNNAMRAQKQDRRAVKGEKRKEQARKTVEEVGSREPQKTLDGRLYQGDPGVQQAMREGSMEKAAPDDHDSLFGDDEDNEMEFEAAPDSDMHDDEAAAGEDVDPYAAHLEAVLEADADKDADADADATKGVEQDDVFGGQTFAGGDHGHHDFSSEESEAE